MAEPEVFPLTVEDAPALTALLARQGPAYLAHFHPFAFDEKTLSGVLRAARKDRFWGLRVKGELAGFWMLRGFDEGYARPAFGVFVAQAYSGQGLARLALQSALDWCTAQKVATVMLKVAPANERARRTYVCAGFDVIGVCPSSGQEILEKRLS